MLKRRSSAAEAPTLPSPHAGKEGRVGALGRGPAAPIKGFCGAAMQAPLSAVRMDAKIAPPATGGSILWPSTATRPRGSAVRQLRRTLGRGLTHFRREFHVQRQGRQVVDASAQAWPCQPARPFVFQPLNLGSLGVGRSEFQSAVEAHRYQKVRHEIGMRLLP